VLSPRFDPGVPLSSSAFCQQEGIRHVAQTIYSQHKLIFVCSSVHLFTQTIILHRQPWRLELPRSLGPFSISSIFVRALWPLSHEIYSFKSGTICHLTKVQSKRTTWIQQKNCNSLRSLLCSPFTTKISLNVHRRQCGRWFHSLFLVYKTY
jgi:hypothetical protein